MRGEEIPGDVDWALERTFERVHRQSFACSHCCTEWKEEWSIHCNYRHYCSDCSYCPDCRSKSQTTMVWVRAVNCCWVCGPFEQWSSIVAWVQPWRSQSQDDVLVIPWERKRKRERSWLILKNNRRWHWMNGLNETRATDGPCTLINIDASKSMYTLPPPHATTYILSAAIFLPALKLSNYDATILILK